MMGKLTRPAALVFMSLFIIGLITFLLNYRTHLPRVLIVHSYSSDYSWVQQINEGIQRVFNNRTDFTLHWQYLDIKNHSEFAYKQKAGLAARQIINRLQPSIIVTVDDDAQSLVGKFYIDDPKISVVFCGVNGQLHTYSYDKAKNVTGILERLPLQAVKETIPFLVPEIKDIHAIKVINLGDQSKTVKFDENSILKFDWSPLNLIDSLLVSTFEDWKKAVKESSKRADCLYITNYRQLETSPGSSRFVSPSEVIHWTEENAGIPILSGNGFIVEEGGSLAVAASAYEQGEVAAKYVLEIIAGKLPCDLPVVETRQFLVFMRKKPAQKKNNLPVFYENFAKGIGKYFE